MQVGYVSMPRPLLSGDRLNGASQEAQRSDGQFTAPRELRTAVAEAKEVHGKECTSLQKQLADVAVASNQHQQAQVCSLLDSVA